jgi:methyl-accepting chemotaxis protein
MAVLSRARLGRGIATLTIGKRIAIAFLALAAMELIMAVVGLGELDRSDRALSHTYNGRLLPLSRLAEVNDLGNDTIQQLTVATIARPSPQNLKKYLERVRKNARDIDALIAEIRAGIGQGEAAEVDAWLQRREAFAKDGLAPAMAALEKQDFNGAEDTILGVAMKRFEAMQEAYKAVAKSQLALAERANAESSERYGLVLKGAIGLLAISALLVGLVAFFVRRSVVLPIQSITGIMTRLSQGDRDVAVPTNEQRDEIGEMVRSIATFKEGLTRAEQLEAEAKRSAEEQLARAKRREELTRDFDAKAGKLLSGVGTALEQVRAASADLKSSADASESRTAAVSAAAREVSQNVQSVASAGTELDGAIGEVAKQAGSVATSASEVGASVQAASDRYKDLTSAAERIGGALKLVEEIASQTNLLALNATIEAARAGEAGKGFAVVAGEVKNLASQTARATSEIGEMIGSIQREAREGAASILQLVAAIKEVESRAAAIAAAVEEQAAATKEISRNAEEVAAANDDVARNVGEVAQETASTRGLALRMNGAADELRREAQSLREEMERFFERMRAA